MEHKLKISNKQVDHASGETFESNVHRGGGVSGVIGDSYVSGIIKEGKVVITETSN